MVVKAAKPLTAKQAAAKLKQQQKQELQATEADAAVVSAATTAPQAAAGVALTAKPKPKSKALAKIKKPSPPSPAQRARAKAAAAAAAAAAATAAAEAASAPAITSGTGVSIQQADRAILDLRELEAKRKQTLEQLRSVEKQIYSLETTYFENANPKGNAIQGYEGLLSATTVSAKRAHFKPEDRIFSGSSTTGTLHLVPA